MSADTGRNQAEQQEAIEQFLQNGVDVRLFTSELAYDDVAADLDTKEVSAASYAAVSTTDLTDWSISHDAANGQMTITNDVDLDFGLAEEDWGTVVDGCLHIAGTDRIIRADEVDDPEITQGEEIVLPAGQFEATFGNTV